MAFANVKPSVCLFHCSRERFSPLLFQSDPFRILCLDRTNDPMNVGSTPIEESGGPGGTLHFVDLVNRLGTNPIEFSIRSFAS